MVMHALNRALDSKTVPPYFSYKKQNINLPNSDNKKKEKKKWNGQQCQLLKNKTEICPTDLLN